MLYKLSSDILTTSTYLVGSTSSNPVRSPPRNARPTLGNYTIYRPLRIPPVWTTLRRLRIPLLHQMIERLIVITVAGSILPHLLVVRRTSQRSSTVHGHRLLCRIYTELVRVLRLHRWRRTTPGTPASATPYAPVGLPLNAYAFNRLVLRSKRRTPIRPFHPTIHHHPFLDGLPPTRRSQ
jgi:hypothetical protein